MLKIISAICVPLFGALSVSVLCCAQDDIGWKEAAQFKLMRLSGVIDSYSNGKVQSFESQTFVWDYDRAGNRTKVTGYDNTGKEPLTWDTYKYDPEHNEIEYSWAMKSHTTPYVRTFSYEFDKHRKIKQWESVDTYDFKHEKHIFEWNDDGKKASDTAYGEDGSIESKEQYKYDPTGNRIEQIESGADASITKKETNSFNKKGNVTQTLSYDGAGRPTGKTIYEYAPDDEHLMKQTEYDAGGKIREQHMLKRRADGFVSEDLELDSKGQPVERHEISYEFYR